MNEASDTINLLRVWDAVLNGTCGYSAVLAAAIRKIRGKQLEGTARIFSQWKNLPASGKFRL
ncbi:hypothetical protein ACFPVT_05045 [Corynebacterium choanae]|uniref:hypothetical protein n=1 Tax=Corynebacterium choanae TaxID=1862358 RepID=UPI000F50A05D|nr:hypothetical protein [Corynebacterium choanae]